MTRITEVVVERRQLATAALRTRNLPARRRWRKARRCWRSASSP